MIRSRIALAVALLASCGPAKNGAKSEAPLAPANEATKNAAALVDEYLKTLLADQPDDGRELGLHEYDGLVQAISPEATAERIARAKQHLEKVAAIDLAQVTDPARLDLELTKLDAERKVFQLETLKLHQKIMVYRGLFDVSGYLVRDYAPVEQRVAKMLDHVEAATARADSLIAMLAVQQPKTHVETARKALSGMREYYEGDVKQQTEPALAKDPALRARYDRVIPAGLAAVDKLIKWIDEVGKRNATDQFALGEQNFLRMLEVNEGLKTTLADLEKTAQADFQRNYDAYVAVAKQIDPKGSVKEVSDRVASERIPKDKVIEAATRQLDELLAFMEKNDIVTLPSQDRATVKVTPPFQRWNSAFLDMAGPFEKAKGSFYYISPPDPSWPKEMQDAYIPWEGDLLSTSIHEVYPGHFVHGLHQRNTPTLATKLLESYAFVEGWAHYTEEMMFNAGYGDGDPKLRMGQLSNALLRNCRFLAAIGLHTRGMTVEQANQLFQEKCFIDPGNAIQQAYRGTFDPGYLSYTLGKLEIMALEKEFVAKRGSKSRREFHDWLLSFGAPPIALLRARL